VNESDLQLKGFVRGADGTWSKLTTVQAHNAPQIGHFEKLPPYDRSEKISVPKRIRQSSKPLMNKLETQFYNVLTVRNPGVVIYKQALRWKLGNGIWYKPDFAATIVERYEDRNLTMTCWEVKGPYAFRGGFENLKVAASLYQDIVWILAWRNGSKWEEQRVLP
jgi:hypothetical protein